MQDFFSDVAIFTLSRALFPMDFYMHLIDFLILVYVKITISKKCVSGAFLNDNICQSCFRHLFCPMREVSHGEILG